MGTDIGSTQTSLQLYLRHSSYRRESLTSEPHRVKGEKVIGMTYLRGGMTLKRQAGIGFRHTLAVVNNLYGGAAGIYHQYVDTMCISVNSILHQLLNDGSRPLYHFACRYLVGDGIG